MSCKAELLQAIAAYTREVRNTPGQQQLVAQLQELQGQVESAPEPEPGQGVPPVHGGTQPEGSSGTVTLNVNLSPEKAGALAAFQNQGK